jgi:preprotein translocase subunit SecD
VAVVLDEEIVAISAAVTTIPVKGQKKSKKKKDEAPPIPGQPDPAPPAESGGEVDIPGGFSGPEEAALLAGVLNAGELPFPLTIRSKQLVGAR